MSHPSLGTGCSCCNRDWHKPLDSEHWLIHPISLFHGCACRPCVRSEFPQNVFFVRSSMCWILFEKFFFWRSFPIKRSQRSWTSLYIKTESFECFKSVWKSCVVEYVSANFSRHSSLAIAISTLRPHMHVTDEMGVSSFHYTSVRACQLSSDFAAVTWQWWWWW